MFTRQAFVDICRFFTAICLLWIVMYLADNALRSSSVTVRLTERHDDQMRELFQKTLKLYNQSCDMLAEETGKRTCGNI